MAYTTIDDPSAYFQTVLWTGNGSARSITLDGNSDMQPDWVWLKRRNSARNHALLDSVRGGTKQLISNSTAVEGTDAQLITSFDSDGFSLGTSNDCNSSGDTFVGWNWLAGGTASSNTDGSITSSVSANTTAGFSIVSWTGNGSNGATIGHGLGVTPAIVITKRRSAVGDWLVGGSLIDTVRGGANSLLLLNGNNAMDSNSEVYQTFSSTTFQVGTNEYANTSGSTMISYCFAEKKGYSKFGSYTGNGNADGPFIYTGFKPAWLLAKKSSGTADWFLIDNKRSTINPTNHQLEANSSAAEDASGRFDFLSNGFKCVSSSTGSNGSGTTYIYMAFAESPLVTSTGIPATAR